MREQKGELPMVIQEEKKTAVKRPHHINLEDREKLMVTGVTEIESFDEETVVLYTDMGELVIRGNKLHIHQLNVETGEFSLDGKVQSLTYLEQSRPSKGFFARLFR